MEVVCVQTCFETMRRNRLWHQSSWNFDSYSPHNWTLSSNDDVFFFLLRKPSTASSTKPVSMVASLHETKQMQQNGVELLKNVNIKHLNSQTASHWIWNNDRIWSFIEMPITPDSGIIRQKNLMSTNVLISNYQQKKLILILNKKKLSKNLILNHQQMDTSKLINL